MHRVALVGLMVTAAASLAWAGKPCCRQCGCGTTQKVCRMVCEMKQEKHVEYACECEDFCVLGPSQYCGTRCVPDPCNPCATIEKRVWKPTCGPMYSRTKLLKREVTVEKPVYKCVVEEVCTGCGRCCSRVEKPVDGAALATLQVAGETAPRAAAVVAPAAVVVPTVHEAPPTAASPVRIPLPE